jgi:hypothetical protein
MTDRTLVADGLPSPDALSTVNPRLAKPGAQEAPIDVKATELVRQQYPNMPAILPSGAPCARIGEEVTVRGTDALTRRRVAGRYRRS